MPVSLEIVIFRRTLAKKIVMMGKWGSNMAIATTQVPTMIKS